MTALKKELMNYINDIPDERLYAIKPLLYMLAEDTFVIEKVDFEDLTNEEKESVIKARKEYENGETINHNDINWD